MSESDKDKFAKLDKGLKDKIEADLQAEKDKKLKEDRLIQDKRDALKEFIQTQQDELSPRIKQLVDWYNHKMDELNKGGSNKLSIYEYGEEFLPHRTAKEKGFRYRYELTQNKCFKKNRLKVDVRVQKHSAYRRLGKKFWGGFFLGDNTFSYVVGEREKLHCSDDSKEKFLEQLEESFIKLVSYYEKGEL